jgi:hypothetical protein
MHRRPNANERLRRDTNMPTKTVPAPRLELSIEINATPRVVIEAFFDGATLSRWWRTSRSVTTPKILGPYALEWPTSEAHDEVLGRLGGVFRGTVMQYEATRGFFVADAFWLPPDGGPIGPFAMEVSCVLCLTADGCPATRVRLTKSGFEESPRWRRYYDVMHTTWQRELESLKNLLEAG